MALVPSTAMPRWNRPLRFALPLSRFMIQRSHWGVEAIVDFGTSTGSAVAALGVVVVDPGAVERVELVTIRVPLGSHTGQGTTGQRHRAHVESPLSFQKMEPLPARVIRRRSRRSTAGVGGAQ